MKKFFKLIIQVKSINYLTAVILTVLIFITLNSIFQNIDSVERSQGWFKTIIYLACLASACAIVWITKVDVPQRTSIPLLDFSGAETDLEISSGVRFLFYIFSLDSHESIGKERDKIEVGPIEFNDVNGKKLRGFVTAIWEAGKTPELRQNFILMKADKLEPDLKSYLERTFIRTFTKKDYFTDIRGKEDMHLQPQEVKIYGVNFVEIDPVVTSGNLEQDDYEYRYDTLTEKKKKKFPQGHHFTNEELSKIHQEVSTTLGRAKLVINEGNGNTLWRADV